MLLGNSRVYAQEYVRQILQCKGDGVWDGASHEVSVDVFAPEPGIQYLVPFAHADDTSSTYADSLTMHCYFNAVFKTGNSAQIYSPHVWLAVPLSRKSSRVLHFKLNSSWGLREKQAKMNLAIDTQELKGKITYKYWTGYTSWGTPDLEFKADLFCAKPDKRLDWLHPLASEQSITSANAGAIQENKTRPAAEGEKGS